MKTVKNRLKRKKRLQKKLQRKTKKKLRGGGVYKTTNSEEWFVCDNPFCYEQYNEDTPGFLTSIPRETESVDSPYVLITMESKSDTSKKYKFKYKEIIDENNCFFYLGKTETEKLNDDYNYTYEVVRDRGNERLPLYYGDTGKEITLVGIPNLEPLMQKLFALIDECPKTIEDKHKGEIIQELVNSTGRYVCKTETNDWEEYKNYPVHKTIDDLKKSIIELKESSKLIQKLNEDLFNIYKSRGNILCYESKTKLCTGMTGELRQNVNNEKIPDNPDGKKHLLLVDTKPFSDINEDNILYSIVLADLAINGIHNIKIEETNNIIFKEIVTDKIYRKDWVDELSKLPETDFKDIDLSVDVLLNPKSSLEDILSKLYRSDLSLVSEGERNNIYIDQFIYELLTKSETEAGDQPEAGSFGSREEQERIKANLSREVAYFNTKCKLLGIENKFDIDLKDKNNFDKITKLETNAFNIHISSINYRENHTGTLALPLDTILSNVDGSDKRNKTHLCPNCGPKIKTLDNNEIIYHMNVIEENKSKLILDRILNSKGCNKPLEQELKELSEDTDKASELRENASPSMLSQALDSTGMDKFIDLLKQQNLSQERITQAILARDIKPDTTLSPEESSKLDANSKLMTEFRENEENIKKIREKINEIQTVITNTDNTSTILEREVKARGEQIEEMKKKLLDIEGKFKNKKKIKKSSWTDMSDSSVRTSWIS